MIDRLISRYVRHLNQRLMNFQVLPDGVRLPTPDADKRYLLYLHVPFCAVLCPFCSFHRVLFKEDKATRYFAALQNEIRVVTQSGYRFSELYVGGGTPTVMPDLLAETIDVVAAAHPLHAVSVETNPHDLNAIKISRLKSAGVTRLSVGVQSFDDKLLKEMQRYDKYGSSADIQSHLNAVKGQFRTLNVDMIFNFPHQDPKSLQADLEILTDKIGVDQVSWYPLMSSRSTEKAMRKNMGSVDHGRERRYYEKISRHMLDAGYERSSAWCFSREPGMFDEYIVEHDEYIGLGSGAFSYLNGALYANTFSINHYLTLVEAGSTGCVQKRALTPLEQMRYYLLMKLFGGTLDLDAADAKFHGAFRRTMWTDIKGLRLIGAIDESADRISLTESGNYLWVVLMREFFSGVNNFREDMRHNISRETEMVSAGFG